MAMKEFNTFILAGNLHDYGYIGNKFTWALKEHVFSKKKCKVRQGFDKFSLVKLLPPIRSYTSYMEKF